MAIPLDPVVAAALRKRDELREELRKIDDFLATYRRIAIELRVDSLNEEGTSKSSTENVAPVSDATDEREASTPHDAPPKRVRVRDNPKPAVVIEEAVKVIRRAGRPLSRREIHARLKEVGVEVRGANPIKTLGTTLWRGRNVLEQIEGAGYWVKGDPLPPLHNPNLSAAARVLFQ